MLFHEIARERKKTQQKEKQVKRSDKNNLHSMGHLVFKSRCIFLFFYFFRVCATCINSCWERKCTVARSLNIFQLYFLSLSLCMCMSCIKFTSLGHRNVTMSANNMKHFHVASILSFLFHCFICIQVRAKVSLCTKRNICSSGDTRETLAQSCTIKRRMNCTTDTKTSIN